MSVFVYDYDHNAPTPQFLKETHESMFNIIRNARPDIPIIMLSRPKIKLVSTDVERMEVISQTYLNAKEKGDNNVYFLSGAQLMEMAGNDGTVEHTHPNAMGFFSMAKAVSEILKKII